MVEKRKVIFIVGPTAVGKTAFSIELAKRISGEIISSDSMQAYRHMDIISQKPTPKQKKRIPHHLIDILDVREEYSAAEFAKRASLFINKILEKKRMPIVVGGSGLYVRALIDGLFYSPKKDLAFRKSLELEAQEFGKGRLHNRLKKIDPQTASNIHPNDLRRIIRALEVFHLTGLAMSEHKRKTKGIKDCFDIMIYGLIRPKATLYRRIEERIERMLEHGLIGEVSFIRKKNPSITAKASLGYEEICGFLDKRYSLENARGLLEKNTKRLVKKQLTWFKADKRIVWVDLEKTPQEEAVKHIRRQISFSLKKKSVSAIMEIAWKKGYQSL